MTEWQILSAVPKLSTLQIRTMTLFGYRAFLLFSPRPCDGEHSFYVRRGGSLLERKTSLAEKDWLNDNVALSALQLANLFVLLKTDL